MGLVVGTNSWASVAEADVYLADRIDAETWFALNESGASGVKTKETLLTSSFHWLSGSPQLSIASSCADANVKNAQCEAAWFLLEYSQEIKDRRAARASGVASVRMSRRWESYQGPPGIPDYILGMLRNYQITNDTAILTGHYDE